MAVFKGCHQTSPKVLLKWWSVFKDCQQRLPKVLLKLCMWKLWMCLCVCVCVCLCVFVCVSVSVCVCIFLKEVKPVRFVVTFHMIFMIVFHSIVINRFFIGRAVEPDYSSCVCVCLCVCACVSTRWPFARCWSVRPRLVSIRVSLHVKISFTGHYTWPKFRWIQLSGFSYSLD